MLNFFFLLFGFLGLKVVLVHKLGKMFVFLEVNPGGQ